MLSKKGLFFFGGGGRGEGGLGYDLFLFKSTIGTTLLYGGALPFSSSLLLSEEYYRVPGWDLNLDLLYTLWQAVAKKSMNYATHKEEKGSQIIIIWLCVWQLMKLEGTVSVGEVLQLGLCDSGTCYTTYSVYTIV